MKKDPKSKMEYTSAHTGGCGFMQKTMMAGLLGLDVNALAFSGDDDWLKDVATPETHLHHLVLEMAIATWMASGWR